MGNFRFCRAVCFFPKVRGAVVRFGKEKGKCYSGGILVPQPGRNNYDTGLLYSEKRYSFHNRVGVERVYLHQKSGFDRG